MHRRLLQVSGRSAVPIAGGEQFRTRSVDVSAAHNGKQCGIPSVSLNVSGFFGVCFGAIFDMS